MGLRHRVMDMRQKRAEFCRGGRHWSRAANQLAPRRSSVSESVAWNTWNGEHNLEDHFDSQPRHGTLIYDLGGILYLV